MSSTEVALPSSTVAAQRADFISQTTAVEQARAVAEVEAAVIVAQRCPRSLTAAIEAMRESCNQPGLADRAFYKFPRAGGTVSGASVHLARELARCWGNIQYGIQELRRDEVGKYSEMQAWAWDVQTNTRSSTTFVVPHKRDVKGGPQALVDLRDVYENNANQGSRRLRETIFSVLPTWFTEEAKELCTATTAKGGGKPLPTRIADCIKVFAEIGIKVDRLEAKVGSPSADWSPLDVSQLGVSYTSIKQGTVTKEDEFPSLRSTTADITAPTPAPATDRDAGGADDREAPGSSHVSPVDVGPANPPASHQTDEESGTPLGEIKRLLRHHGYDDKDAARACAQVLGRDVVNAGKDTTTAEKLRVKRALEADSFTLAPESSGTDQTGEMMTGAQWREQAAKRKVSVADLIVEANAFLWADDPDAQRYATVDEFVGSSVANLLWLWLKGQS